MQLPKESVTLSVAQLSELNQRLADMRHDINNYLSLIVAASELMRQKPHTAERMLATLADQPQKITSAVQKFTAEFETALKISRG